MADLRPHPSPQAARKVEKVEVNYSRAAKQVREACA